MLTERKDNIFLHSIPPSSLGSSTYSEEGETLNKVVINWKKKYLTKKELWIYLHQI